MVVLFLDIDGVLVTDKHIAKLSTEEKPLKDGFGPFFDPDAVEQLVRIVKKTNAKVVISSSYRLDGVERMKEVFRVRNIDIDIVGVTPFLLCGTEEEPRGKEIYMYLGVHCLDIEDYIIIDDDSDFYDPQLKHFIKTNSLVGITKQDADRAIAFLGDGGIREVKKHLNLSRNKS